MTAQDPRRQRPIKIAWRNDTVGCLTIDGELWAAVEWSEKRQTWCIEDAEGRCLSHSSHIRGQHAAKQGAVTLAEAMIRDGRMPTPSEALQQRKQRLKRQREQRRNRPSEIRRREQREQKMELSRLAWDAEDKDKEAPPLYEAIASVFDLSDPELWRSNAFASLRPRLILHLEAVVASLRYEEAVCNWCEEDEEERQRLARALQILSVLKDGAP
jgi:hypothetical protein